MFGGDEDEGVVALGAEAGATARYVEVAVWVVLVERGAWGDGFVWGEALAVGRAVQGAAGGDVGGGYAEAMADEEGEGGVLDEAGSPGG